MELYSEAVNYLQEYGVEVAKKEQEDLEEVFDVDDEFIPSSSSPRSLLRSDSIELLEVPGNYDSESMLRKRMVVLKSILDSEQLYLYELETLMMPIKALKATACTSQPVLTEQQIQTVFFQVPELLDLHRAFYESLKERVELGESSDSVGELFQKMVSQLCTYRGFIDNYENAVQTVHKCMQTDERFKTLAEDMSCKQTKAKYTIEALLYKPLDRVTKTTLVLHDLLKHTPEEHLDYPLLQEALRISSCFLSVVNEEVPNKKSTVTLSKGKVRQLVKDGFLVDFSNGNRSFRHIFLFTDLILCAKLKQGKHPHYRFDWYLPVSGLTVRCGQECNIPSCYQLRMKDLKQKIFLLRRNIQQEKRSSKILAMRTSDRAKKKLLEYESWMLTHSPTVPLELHSRYGKSHTLLLSSLYELYEWKDCIEKLTGESFEKISVDLLKLTSSCVKLRSVHHPPSSSFIEENTDKGLCGTLSVMVHSATGYQKPANTYISLELDSFGYFENRGQTRVLMDVSEPIWEEEFSLEVDGAHCLRLLCIQQQETGESLIEDKILGKTQVELETNFTQNKWRRTVVTLNEIQVSVSLKYSAHGLQPPGSSCTDQSDVFGVLLGITAEREGVLVPNIVRYCVEEIDRRGLEEVGIYRISGIATEIQALRTAFNTNLQDAITRLKTVDVNAVSGTLKLYFRELPEPLIPPEFFQPLARGLEIADKEKKEYSMIELLQEIPDANRNTFLFLVQHLKRVSEKKDVNKMTIHNLATVFGPSLLRPPKDSQSDAVDISQEVVVQVQVVFYYLLYNNLPAPQTRRKTYTESEET